MYVCRKSFYKKSQEKIVAYISDVTVHRQGHYWTKDPESKSRVLIEAKLDENR